MGDRFHTNSPLAPGVVALRGPEAHHLGTVCRARPGDELRLFNGDGHEYPARVVEVSRSDVVVEVLRVESPKRELEFTLHVAAPLPKGDRAQFLVEKMTELGVTTLTLLATSRSVFIPREAKLDRLNRHIIEASKQCGRNRLMSLVGPVPWEELVRREAATMRLFGHPGGGPMPTHADGAVAVAVGPEGGLTEDEVALAVSAGWRPVGLGRTILRVETAAVALAARIVAG